MDNKNLILKFFHMINERDLNALEKYLAEYAHFHFQKTNHLPNKSRILKFMAFLWKMYPALHFYVQRIIMQGNMTAVHWANHGHTRKNESSNNEGVTILAHKGGKITCISDFFKSTENF